MVKRGLDITLAGLLLVCTLPVLAVAALLIKLDSDGPILFCQERMGRNFKRFRLVKLRTMRPSTSGLAYTLGADPRITRVGQRLRWLKIDELPQLWNVLRGDMSLVGPRPVVPELAIEFKKSYEILLMARPGLTDPATVKYCREAEMLAVVPEPLRFFKRVVTPDKLRISESYLRNANVWNDLCVIAATVKALSWSIRHIKPIDAMPVERGLAPVLEFKGPARKVVLDPRSAKVGMVTAGLRTAAIDGSTVRAGAGLRRSRFGPVAMPQVVPGLMGHQPAPKAGDRGLFVP